jgi:hypothetical protein
VVNFNRVMSIQLALLMLGLTSLALIDWHAATELTIEPLFAGAPALDWELFRDAGRLIASGQSPYDARVEACGNVCAFRHSPLVAWFYAIPFGIEWFRAAQVASLILLPPVLGLAVLATWAFWADVAMGQTITFAFVLAVIALRGSRWAGVAFLVYVTLMPRPLMLPVAAWLLWKQPGVRVPFLAISVIHLGLVMWMGWAGTWVMSLLTATGDMALPVNYSPSRWLGLWWILVGVPLALWLFRRGQLGLASLALSPYLFPYYLLMGLTPPQQPAQGCAGPACRVAGARPHSSSDPNSTAGSPRTAYRLRSHSGWLAGRCLKPWSEKTTTAADGSAAMLASSTRSTRGFR